MPELPHVQVFAEHVDATSLHREIAGVEVGDTERLFDGVSREELVRRLRGASLTETRRHGKHLFLRSDDDGWLRLHFGMTGELVAWSADEEAPDLEHVELRLDFEDGSHLAYRIPRKLGEIGWVEDVDEFVAERGLGPDPLAPDFGLPVFRDVLVGRRGRIKPTLMNQEVIAGLGNEVVDEILFQIGLHPEATVDDLDDDTIGELHNAMIQIIERIVGSRGDVDELAEDFLLAHRSADEECPRCGVRLTKTEVGGRATYFCSRHQQRRH